MAAHHPDTAVALMLLHVANRHAEPSDPSRAKSRLLRTPRLIRGILLIPPGLFSIFAYGAFLAAAKGSMNRGRSRAGI
jgi:hypothetical protein